MEEVWDGPGMSVRQVWKKLEGEQKLAYTTVMTILTRLWEKKMVRRRKQGRGYVYFAKQDRVEAVRGLVQQAMERLVNEYGLEAVAAFSEEAERMSQENKRKLVGKLERK